MYSKYKDIPVLTRADSMEKMKIELLVKLNEKLDKLSELSKNNITEEKDQGGYSLPTNPVVRENMINIPDIPEKKDKITVVTRRQSLESMTKKELIAISKDRKIKINERDKKEKIISDLLEKM